MEVCRAYFLKEKNFTLAERSTHDLDGVINQHRLQSGNAILVVLVNGYFMPELSDMHKVPENITIGNNPFKKTTGDANKYPFAN